MKIDSNEDSSVLAAASAYNKKYYLNPEFNGLPKDVLDEVRDICLEYSQKLHCTFTISFKNSSSVAFGVAADEADHQFDDIGAVLEIKKLTQEKRELATALTMWHKLVYKRRKGNGKGI